MDDLLNEFLTETAESIDVVDVELVKLEQDPNNKEVLDNIFRLVHTIKGTCGFLGLPRLEAVAHSSENVLGKFRDGDLNVTPEAVTVVLESLDRIKEILSGLEATEEEPQGDDSALIAHLDEIAEGRGQERTISSPPVAEVAILGRPLKAGEVDLDELERVFRDTPGPEDNALAANDDVSEHVTVDTPDESQAVEKKAEGRVVSESSARDNSVEKRTSQSIRVSVDLLEDLMNMVSELVLTRNQLLQMVREKEDSEFNVPIQRLSQTTTELQEGVMKTRMQPIGNAWAKLPRIIRDLSIELDKKIDLDMHGADTELDRQVLELIKDPLTHMVRNSADHGVEKPAERLAAGKPENGTIRLNAYHEGGHIIIEISDDGRGIAAGRIGAKAVEKGLVSDAELSDMSEAQIQRFVFHPGFSTAASVTSVSGRGVGMDVVRNNIEKIGGAIDMISVEGKGTTFQIKIPLTLAIVSALIVEAAGERFAIPQISVLELVRASASSDNKIEKIKDTPVLRLRNRLLPLVHLNSILGFDIQVRDEADDYIVVAQVGAFTFGIVVDQVFDTEEIVVKPVAPILKSLSIYSGNTILGDGSVIMILDPNGIAESANAAVSDDDTVAEEKVADTVDVNAGGRESLLLFRAGKNTRKAVSLPLVARLEDIPVDRIELSDGRYVVQYRGALMPIILANGAENFKAEGRQPILVFTDGDYTMGLAVDEILDIVEDHVDVTLASESDGTVGSAIIGGHATEVIDVTHYLGLAFDGWLKSRDKANDQAPAKGARVLLIDDSAFFRNMLKPLLKVAGYSLVCVDHAQAALDLREAGEVFDLIISDIDMPGMDGFELTKILKKDGRWCDTPIVALSSFSSEKHLERGRQVGFNDFIAKFDRKALLSSLAQQLRLSGDAA